MSQAQLSFDIRDSAAPTDNQDRARAMAGRPVCVSEATPPAVLMSVTDVAHVLRCGRTLVYELINAGELEAIKLGRLRRVPTAAVDALVERLRETGRNTN